MSFKTFGNRGSQFPFRFNQLLSTTWIFLLIFGFFMTAATGQEQTIDAEQTRKLLKQAEKLLSKGETAEAEKFFRRVLEINPAESNAKTNLAYLLVKRQQLGEAYNLAFETAEREPGNARAFAVLGAALTGAGSFEQAKSMFVNALQLNKREALAWAGLGTIDFYENRISDSILNLQEAIYYEPNEPDFVFSLAQILARAEKYKAAAEAYDHFLEIAPQADIERRERIKGLINFLKFLGNKRYLYVLKGEDQTIVPFRLRNNRPVIQVRVNEKDEPLNFVLDTGSGISVISEETAQRMKIKTVTKGGLARAIGGDGKFQIVYGFLKTVSVGSVKIRNVPVYIREFHGKDEKIDGYIGLSLISKFLTTIDYGTSTFALKKKEFNKNQTVAEHSLSLPLRLTSSGFLSGEVQLEGVESPLNFIVDTGASVSVISDEVAKLEEISRFVNDDKMRVIGAAGVIEEVSSFMLPKVTFGTHSRESIMAVALNLDIINEASGFQQAGILGGNFLKNYRLVFDFENSKVLFVPLK